MKQPNVDIVNDVESMETDCNIVEIVVKKMYLYWRNVYKNIRKDYFQAKG